MTQDAPGSPRGQRLLATIAFTLIGLSAIDVIALLVLTAAGVQGTAANNGGLLVMKLLPLIALPIGLVLVVALVIVLIVRRARDQGSQRGRR